MKKFKVNICRYGINVSDIETGDLLDGKSHIAANTALYHTTSTRMLIPLGFFIAPPVAIYYLKKFKLYPKN